MPKVSKESPLNGDGGHIETHNLEEVKKWLM